MSGLSIEQHVQDFLKMYYQSPLYINDIKPAHIGDLLNVYSEANSLEDRDSFTLLHFSNWIICKVKEDHEFCLTFPTKEMLVLVFVVEQVYQIESDWKRDFRTLELKGGWKEVE